MRYLLLVLGLALNLGITAQDLTDEEIQQMQIHHANAMEHFGWGDYPEALKELDKALAIYPEQNMYLYQRAYCKQMLADYQGALNDYNAVEALGGYRDPLYYYRALCYQSLGQYELSINDLYTYLEIDPTNPDANFYLGRGLHETGELDAALEAYNDGVTSQIPESYYYRGNLLWELDRQQEACNDWQTAVDLNYSDAAEQLVEHCE